MANVTLIQILLMNVLVLLAIGSLSSGQTTPKNVICYVPFWSLPTFTFSESHPTFTISKIDASLCTHVVYSLLYFDSEKLSIALSTGTFYRDHPSEWRELVNLRRANPSLKVLLQVSDPGTFLAAISQDDEQTFFKNVIAFLRRWGFDGLDHQWLKQTKPTVVDLIEGMHAAFEAEATSSGRDPLILMITLLAFGNDLDVQRVTQAVDIVHIETHHYDHRFSGRVGLSTPLYGSGINNGDVSQTISSVLDAGVPPEKVHLTIQFSAVTFTLSDTELTEVGAPSTKKGKPGEYRGMNGELAYYEVCKRLQDQAYTAEFDPVGLVNFAYKGNQWMTYEDPASLEIKMNYVYEHNLGGVTARYLYDDDFSGQFCNQGRYPLLSTLYNYKHIPTTTTPTTTTTAQTQTCSSTVVEVLQDPYSCEHYRICVYGQLNRYECPHGLSFDSDKGYCVMNRTTS